MKNPERDLFIAEWYEEVSAETIADQLGITVDTVYSRAYRLGLSRKRGVRGKIDQRDIWLMHELYKDGHSIPEIALKFDITKKQCADFIDLEIVEMLF